MCFGCPGPRGNLPCGFENRWERSPLGWGSGGGGDGEQRPRGCWGRQDPCRGLCCSLLPGEPGGSWEPHRPGSWGAGRGDWPGTGRPTWVTGSHPSDDWCSGSGGAQHFSAPQARGHPAWLRALREVGTPPPKGKSCPSDAPEGAVVSRGKQRAARGTQGFSQFLLHRPASSSDTVTAAPPRLARTPLEREPR